MTECYFTPKKDTTSATICANCGEEKILHTIGDGIKASTVIISSGSDKAPEHGGEKWKELEGYEMDLPDNIKIYYSGKDITDQCRINGNIITLPKITNHDHYTKKVL